MLRVIIILTLFFNFQSLTKAENISDFEIEGITIGDSFIKTQQKLSYVGLNLDQFGDIVAQNLPTMRELGRNTEEGSQNFIKAHFAFFP